MITGMNQPPKVIDMKQCETCIDKELKENTICCQVHQYRFEVRNILKTIPILGKFIPDYECEDYEEEQPEWLKAFGQHPNCRCSVVPVFEGEENV